MKKALVILMILGIVGGAFAQEFKISGNITGGVQAWFRGENGGNPAYADQRLLMNSGSGGARVNLTGALTNAEKTSGTSFSLRWSAGATKVVNYETFTWLHAYAWFKPMDMLTIYGGKGGPGGFGTPASVGASNDVLAASDGGLNMSIKLEPMAGLVVGFSVMPAAETAAAAAVTATDGSTTVIVTAAKEASYGFFEKATYAFGANYTMPGLVNVVANAAVGGASATTEGKPTFGFAAGFNVIALTDMGLTKAAVDAQLRRLDDFNDSGDFQLGETFTFVTGDISATLRSTQLFPMGIVETNDRPMVLRIGLSAEMKMGDLTPSLGVGFVSGHGVNKAGDSSWGALGSGVAGSTSSFGKLGEATNTKDYSGLTINPQVVIKIGGGTITAGYLALIQMHEVEANSFFNNLIYLSFNHAF